MLDAPEPDALAGAAVFADLDDDQRRVVASWLEVADVSAGRRLTHQGAAGYAFFIIREGSADVLVDDEVVRTLGSGDFFGEVSILGDGRQTGTVVATTDARVWVMFGTRFRQLQQQYPAIAAAIADTAEQRHREFR